MNVLTGGRVLAGAAIAALLALSGISNAADYTQRLTGDVKVDMSQYIPAQAVRGGGSCGDGVLNAGEICDDNGAAGGCSDSCDSVDYGYSCTLPGEPSVDIVGNAVADGSFEVGSPSADWAEASTNFGTPLCTVALCSTGTGTGPNSGTWWAWFGGAGVGIAETASVQQSVTIPSGTTDMTFEFEAIVCGDDANVDFIELQIDTNVEWRRDAATATECGVLGYATQTVDVSAYADDGLHTILFTSETCASGLCTGGSNFFVDDINIGGVVTTVPVPSECTDGCAPVPGGDFENGLGDWTIFNDNPTASWDWGTSDDGNCGGGGGAPGNWTGLTGNSACIDSDAAGTAVGDIDAYLCSPAVNLSATTGAALTFGYDFQLFATPAADDFFEVLVGTATPVDSTALLGYTTTSIVPLDIGGIPVGSDPEGGRDNVLGGSASIDISAFDGASAVHVCYRYGGNFDWYGQIDDVQISGTACNDSDLDGIANTVDLCTQVPQVVGAGSDAGLPGDCDTDGDGFGNACDGDLTQSGQSVFVDLFAFKDLFGAAGIGSAADFNCSGGPVNFSDLARFGELFGTMPGPSGTTP